MAARLGRYGRSIIWVVSSIPIEEAGDGGAHPVDLEAGRLPWLAVHILECRAVALWSITVLQ